MQHHHDLTNCCQLTCFGQHLATLACYLKHQLPLSFLLGGNEAKVAGQKQHYVTQQIAYAGPKQDTLRMPRKCFAVLPLRRSAHVNT
jgi:hypothetical protein